MWWNKNKPNQQLPAILDQYLKEAPSPQLLVDLFKGEWSSALPPVHGIALQSGHAGLFDDQRIRLLHEAFPLAGKSVLELGPLEAGHTYMMHQLGAASIAAVESNSRAFMKCLLVKELYHLERTRFLLGDVMKYLESAPERVDICVASGILYHMTEPARFLQLCSRVSDRLFIWTHYADPAMVNTHPVLKQKIKRQDEVQFQGYTYTEFHYEYTDALGWAGFCGGANPFCKWITKGALMDLLNIFGYTHVRVFFDDTGNHPNGPNICLLAER